MSQYFPGFEQPGHDFSGEFPCPSRYSLLPLAMFQETQYALNVLGQALVGVGNCLAVSVPTMVSQNWFPESERLVATGILSLSMPIGMVLGQGITPTFVSCPEDVPTMNIVWFVPALTCFLSCLVTITSSQPPSPPSRSAQLARDHQDLNPSRADLLKKYFLNLKSVFTNLKFMVLFAVMGGAVGFVNAFFTQLSQVMMVRLMLMIMMTI